MKVVYNYATSSHLETEFESYLSEGIEIHHCAESDDNGLFHLLQDADVLWHCLRPVDQSVIEAAPKLSLIQKIGVGINTIDLKAAAKRKIHVCNMPGTNQIAVAEHTLALMLATLRQIPAFDEDTRNLNGWSWPAGRQDSLGEIHGRTIGFLGFGRIPHTLAPILKAMGANLIYHARSDKRHDLASFVTLPELMERSDILSLHAPLNASTQGIVGAEQLQRMKPGSFLINTARGALVDQSALVNALKNGTLAGVGLDVFNEEPLDVSSEILKLANVVLTPHTAWLTQETLQRSFDVAIDNVRRLRDNQPLNFEII